MNYSLYLHPSINLKEDINSASTDITKLIQMLISKQVVQSQQTSSLTFSTDVSLMEFVTYLGCSPIQGSEHSNSLLHIHSFPQVTGLGGESIVTLRYPSCKHEIKNATQLIKAYPDNTFWQCPECSNSGQIHQINWRKSAGFADFFIEITSIFPKEAVPNDAFLNLLKPCNHKDWTWFYAKSS